jgi:hypothetical protein
LLSDGFEGDGGRRLRRAEDFQKESRCSLTDLQELGILRNEGARNAEQTNNKGVINKGDYVGMSRVSEKVFTHTFFIRH